jgi:hypothetical protein
MRRDKPQQKIATHIKQDVSISKAFSIAIITVSSMVFTDKLKKEEAPDNIRRRCLSIQRKYGYWKCIENLPGIVKAMEENPKVSLKLQEKGNPVKVPLLWQPLKEFYNKLKGEKNAETTM